MSLLMKPLQLKAALTILEHVVFTDTTPENYFNLLGFGKDAPVGCLIDVYTSPESVTDIIAQ